VFCHGIFSRSVGVIVSHRETLGKLNELQNLQNLMIRAKRKHTVTVRLNDEEAKILENECIRRGNIAAAEILRELIVSLKKAS
jgi:hypothetical protein